MRFMLLSAGKTNIIHRRKNFLRNIVIVLCRWLSANVGRRAYNGFLKSVAQLVRERLFSYPNANRSIVGNQIRRQINRPVQNYGCRFGNGIDEFPSHARHRFDIALQSGVGIDETDEGL